MGSTQLLPQASLVLLALLASPGWAQVQSCSWACGWTGGSDLGLPGILLVA